MEEFKTEGMWGWRSLVSVPSASTGSSSTTGISKTKKSLPGQRFRVATFNLLAQSLVTSTRFPYVQLQALKWRHRRVQLLKEMLSFNADILLLQEVDNYVEWWQPKMGLAGYDGIYRQKEGHSRDGLAIFFKRDLFQLFQTRNVNFNDIGHLFENPARAQTNDIALIAGLQPWEDSTHVTGLCVVNAQLTGERTLREVHAAQTRHLLKEVEAFNSSFTLPVVLGGSLNCDPDSDEYYVICNGMEPSKPLPPEKLEDPPVAGEPSTSTLTVRWMKPHEGDAPIIGYRLKRRAGGNTAVGFGKEFIIEGEDTTHFIACALASGTSYEFIVAAESSVGVGPWSEPSYPLETKTNPANPPKNVALRPAPPPKSEEQLQIERKARIDAEVAERKRKGMDVTVRVIDSKEADEYDSSDDDDIGTGYGHSTGAAGVGVRAFPVEERGTGACTYSNTTPRFEDGRSNLRISPVRRPYASGTGRRLESRVHCMCLASAYGTYNAGGEPRATLIHDKYAGTCDYIFYQHESLHLARRMTIPTNDDVRDIDPRKPATAPDPYDKKPDNWDDRKRIQVPNFETGDMDEVENPEYQGTWKPRMVANMDKWHNFLPNATFSSDHFCLMAELEYKPKLITANGWNSDVLVAGRVQPKHEDIGSDNSGKK